jgi:hypothetical protein
MEGDVSFGCGIDYWMYNSSIVNPEEGCGGSVGDLFMIPVTVIPSVLRPEVWMYASGITLMLGCVILLLHCKNKYSEP